MLALVHQQYKRNDTDPLRGTFRVRGDVIEITPGHTDRYLIRIELFDDEIERICEVDPVTGHVNQAYHYILFIRQMDMRQAWMLLKGQLQALKKSWKIV